MNKSSGSRVIHPELKIRISHIIFVIILTVGLTSFANMSGYSLLHGKVAFELIFFFIASYLVLRLHKSISLYTFFAFIYLLYSCFVFIIFDNQAKITDFFLVYKVIIYIIILSFFIKKELFTEQFLKTFLYTLATLFLFKYSISFIFNFSDRPALFSENNFELMMLMLLYIALCSVTNSANKFLLLLIFIVIILSGSRSGALSFVCMTFFIDFKLKGTAKLLKIFSLTVAVLGLIFVFFIRLAGRSVEDIDRVRFLYSFFNEVRDWDWWRFLIGAPVMTPLSADTAQSFSYYYTLFSDHENLVAYSVVFHSFILRTIFDHGLIGLSFIIAFLYKALNLSGFRKNEIFAALTVVIANGLSVSSLNSVYAIFAFATIFLLKRKNSERVVYDQKK